MFRPDYNGATTLLSKALSKRNISIPSDKPLYDAVLDYFEDNDFYLAAILLGKQTTGHDWHYVEVGENSIFNRSMDPINVADSLSAAVGSVISEIDSEHAYPDSIKLNGKAIEFHANGELMFRIGKIEFTEVDQALSKRCATLFKGIKRYGDNPRISKRLQSFPHLESTAFDEFMNHGAPRGAAMISMVENFPVFLREMLSERFGVDIKQSLALDIVAEMFGAKSWHVIKSAADSMSSVIFPVMVEVTNEDKTSVSYYKSNSDAIVGFSNQLKTRTDREQLKVVFHGGGVSFESSFITAHNPVFDTHHNGVAYHVNTLYLSAPAEVGVNDSMLDSLSWINDVSLDELVTKLKDVLLVDSPLISKLFASSDRRNDKILTIKDYLFTLVTGETPTSTILKVEKFSEDRNQLHSDKDQVAAAATYKAQLLIKPEGYVLMGDYGNEKIATLYGLEDGDLELLSRFSKIPINELDFAESTVH